MKMVWSMTRSRAHQVRLPNLCQDQCQGQQSLPKEHNKAANPKSHSSKRFVYQCFTREDDLTLSLPRVLSPKLRGKSWISVCKIVKTNSNTWKSGIHIRSRLVVRDDQNIVRTTKITWILVLWTSKIWVRNLHMSTCLLLIPRPTGTFRKQRQICSFLLWSNHNFGRHVW